MWKRHFWNLVIFVWVISSVSGIVITEVEINPSGSDSGGEWIEFFSEEEVNLSNYRIVNNDGDEILLSGTFKDIFVYEIGKQWLDNSDERVVLFEGDEKVFETDIFKDSKNDGKTWSYCSDWDFGESSKGEENECSTSDSTSSSSYSEDEDIIEDVVNSTLEFTENSSISNESFDKLNLENNEEVIYLAPQSIKSSQDKNEKLLHPQSSH